MTSRITSYNVCYTKLLREELVADNIRGTAYLGQQKWSEAEQAFRAALELRPEQPRLLSNLAVALIQQGRTEEAVPLLDRSLAVDPQNLYALYNLGLIEKNRGNFSYNFV